jgi:hypothetical protein
MKGRRGINKLSAISDQASNQTLWGEQTGNCPTCMFVIISNQNSQPIHGCTSLNVDIVVDKTARQTWCRCSKAT